MNINLPYIKMMREKKGLSMQYMAELLGFKSAPAYFHMKRVRENSGRTCYRS